MLASENIYHEDACTFLRQLPDESADIIIADPPYFIGFDGGKGWDSVWASEVEYLSWTEEWTRECVRVLKPNRMLIVWGTLKTDTFLRYKLNVLNAMPNLVSQQEIIWSYNWGGRSKKNFARKHEYAWCYSKGAQFLFNADDVRVERKVKRNIRTGEAYDKGTVPTSIWEVNNHTMGADAVSWHPTAKNITVLERMILAYTNPGDLVVDPFMGSGSTALAAMRAGRRWMGCDADIEYVTRASNRIQLALEEGGN